MPLYQQPFARDRRSLAAQVRLAAVMGNVGELKRAGMSLPSVTDNQRRSLLHIAAMHGQACVKRS